MSIMRLSMLLMAVAAHAGTGSRVPIKAVYEHSAEKSWIDKKVYQSKLVGDMRRPEAWSLQGKGDLRFGEESGARNLNVAVSLQGQTGLPVATARCAIANEDWRPYNRLSFWVRTHARGIPILTLMVTIRNQSGAAISEVHLREATHNITPRLGQWTRITWEIPHVARERVTSLEFRPWVNKRLSDPWDRVSYEIRQIELERVDADQFEGWTVAPGRIAFSHTGYRSQSAKTAIAGGLQAGEFEVVDATTGAVALRAPVRASKTRLGEFQVLDFSSVRKPGSYKLRAGGVQSGAFRIGASVWDQTISKTINFFYGERCGVEIPGLHEACHRDWQALQGDQKIVMNGGWHDAGDLSQGMVNTGEATYAMFKLAAELKAQGQGELLAPVVEEARWGLDWIHKVRFPGGFRIGFASLNIWTNGILGDQDDRTRVALNNPNVNYIAAAAGAAAYHYLKQSDPELAAKSLAVAEEDWRHAITGVESPETQSTPAFAATEMELAAIGAIASAELFKATGREEYARKARELSAIVVASQQKKYAGSSFPLSGFFYTGPDRKSIFHQFHRATDQAPVTAMALMCDTFPKDADWMSWYATAVRHSEFQKRAASTTAPYEVLPAYVYRGNEWETIAEADRYGSSRDAYRQQVQGGMPMGDDFYLKAFPVWFTRRGNYGVLLSQAAGLASVARLRGDADSAALAERQLQWVVGRNPFARSTMWGEGYDFDPQYSVSVGDITGSLPVGMMTRENGDAPYWPATNTYVFKEVWIHPSVRWLSILTDLRAEERRRDRLDFTVTQTTKGDEVTLTVTARGEGTHSFDIRAENLDFSQEVRKLSLKRDVAGSVSWKARVQASDEPWIAVVTADGEPSLRRDATGVR